MNYENVKMLDNFQIGSEPPTDSVASCVSDLSAKLGHVTIVRKGGEDVITDGKNCEYSFEAVFRVTNFQ